MGFVVNENKEFIVFDDPSVCHTYKYKYILLSKISTNECHSKCRVKWLCSTYWDYDGTVNFVTPETHGMKILKLNSVTILYH